MSAAADAVHARLELMLAELRLPTVRRLAADVCAQSDREGWPGQRLELAPEKWTPRGLLFLTLWRMYEGRTRSEIHG